jgi:hypothetical protein
MIEIRRFRAKGDTGEMYMVIEYQEVKSDATFPIPNSEMLGLKSWVTASGLTVSLGNVGKTFVIELTGEIIREF